MDIAQLKKEKKLAIRKEKILAYANRYDLLRFYPETEILSLASSNEIRKVKKDLRYLRYIKNLLNDAINLGLLDNSYRHTLEKNFRNIDLREELNNLKSAVKRKKSNSKSGKKKKGFRQFIRIIYTPMRK